MLTACQLPSDHLGLGNLGPREGKAPAQAHQLKEQSEARNPGSVTPAHQGAAGQQSGEGSQCTHLLQRKALLAAHKSGWTLLILFTGLADWASPYKSSRVIYGEALEGLKARLTWVPGEGQISAARARSARTPHPPREGWKRGPLLYHPHPMSHSTFLFKSAPLLAGFWPSVKVPKTKLLVLLGPVSIK